MRPTRRSLLLPLAVALLAVLAATGYWLGPPQVPPDVTFGWAAARALWQGQNPYTVVPAVVGRAEFYYPLPAALLMLPVAWLPLPVAHVVFAALSGLAFALAARRLGAGVMAGGLSACFLGAVSGGQWSPLLLASAALPWAAVTWAAKPNVGLAYAMGFLTWRRLGWAVAVAVLSLAVWPGWPLAWRRVLAHPNHIAPILRPGGFLILLALLRWRDPACRVLGTMALVPSTVFPYEALPLFLVCRTRWQGYALAGLSWAVAFGQHLVMPKGGAELDAARGWPLLLCGLYLPALWLALRPLAWPRVRQLVGSGSVGGV